MTATSDTAPPAADTAPSFTDRVARIAALGWSDREATSSGRVGFLPLPGGINQTRATPRGVQH